MEAERRRSRVRKPLSDCTNTIPTVSSKSSSSSSLRLKPQKPLFSSAIKKLLPNTETKSINNNITNSQQAPSSTQNDDASQQQQQHVSLLPPQVASTPSRPPKSSSDSGMLVSTIIYFGFENLGFVLVFDFGGNLIYLVFGLMNRLIE